jgi:glycerol-3-phosphate cytidylyltransferase
MEFDSIYKVCRDLRQTLNETGESPIIGFTCSSFDLLHSGHYLMLEDCKTHCDILIVGLQDDPTLDADYRVKTGGKNKNRPIQSYEERLIQISGVKHVNHVVKYSTEGELIELLKLIKPDIRMIGEDWRGKEFTGHDLGIHIRFNPRSHSYSTSALRKRVYEAERLKIGSE